MNPFQRYKKYLAGNLLPANNSVTIGRTVPASFILFLTIMALSSNAQTSNVQLVGKVIDDHTKEPLTGAVVHIKGTTHNVVTNEEGEFTFITGQKVPVVYEISHVGYTTQTVAVNDYRHVDIHLRLV